MTTDYRSSHADHHHSLYCYRLICLSGSPSKMIEFYYFSMAMKPKRQYFIRYLSTALQPAHHSKQCKEPEPVNFTVTLVLKRPLLHPLFTLLISPPLFSLLHYYYTNAHSTVASCQCLLFSGFHNSNFMTYGDQHLISTTFREREKLPFQFFTARQNADTCKQNDDPTKTPR